MRKGNGIALFLWLVLFCARAWSASDVEWTDPGGAREAAHFSSLAQINTSTLSRLGLAWWFDIPGIVSTTSVPLEAGGRLYFVTGYSVVRAVDASDGRLLWSYDPQVSLVAGRKLRVLWGSRGLALGNNKVFIGTQDGRLITLDASTGRVLWSVQTTLPGDLRTITGPPLVFEDRVLIGHGLAEYGPIRGYVTAYSADTGKQLWRFFTVPPNPNKGFENDAMAMAARTWSGHWWTYGGGGTVWNAMTYDPDLKRVYIGTGNGSPTSARIRSPQGGDNLFLASIVALDARTGTYLWHYQANPAETWDFDAATDIELANLVIDGRTRHVLMQASKNGFFYVIDRDQGRLISAEKFAKVTWAKRIDLQTGRPVETDGAREESRRQIVWPWEGGAHSQQPMAFNPATHLAYIPVLDRVDDSKQGPIGVNVKSLLQGVLLAWSPTSQSAAWRLVLPTVWNGGILTTAGNLVFQGRGDGSFLAYAADTGKPLWTFDTQVGILSAPITYQVNDRQYISIVAGYSGLAATAASPWDARTQRRRVLTFALDADRLLPPPPPSRGLEVIRDPEFRQNLRTEQIGAAEYSAHCSVCHGSRAVAGGTAPDLRASSVILSSEAFTHVVRDGALLPQGMPRFEEFSAAEIENLRQYVRARAKNAALTPPSSPAPQ